MLTPEFVIAKNVANRYNSELKRLNEGGDIYEQLRRHNIPEGFFAIPKERVLDNVVTSNANNPKYTRETKGFRTIDGNSEMASQFKRAHLRTLVGLQKTNHNTDGYTIFLFFGCWVI